MDALDDAAACEIVIDVEKLNVDMLRRFEPRRARGETPKEACESRFCCCCCCAVAKGGFRDVRSARTSTSPASMRAARVVSNEVRDLRPAAVRVRSV